MPKLIHAGDRVGVAVKLPPRLLLYFFSFLSTPTEQSIERDLTLNAPQDVFWW